MIPDRLIKRIKQKSDLKRNNFNCNDPYCTATVNRVSLFLIGCPRRLSSTTTGWPKHGSVTWAYLSTRRRSRSRRVRELSTRPSTRWPWKDVPGGSVSPYSLSLLSSPLHPSLSCSFFHSPSASIFPSQHPSPLPHPALSPSTEVDRALKHVVMRCLTCHLLYGRRRPLIEHFFPTNTYVALQITGGGRLMDAPRSVT